MNWLSDPIRPGTVLATRITLAVLAAVVLLGEVLVVIGGESLAVLHPEFEHLHLPFIMAALAFGVCGEVALILTAALVGYSQDRRIFEPAALRLIGCLIGAIAVATLIVVSVLTAIPGPPLLALVLFSGAVAGATSALFLSVLRSRLRKAAVKHVDLDEVA
jgi:hypothetical protein